MHISEEQTAAQAIDTALPGEQEVSVEEIAPGVTTAVIAEPPPAEAPDDTVDLAYRLGRLETRLAACEASITSTNTLLAGLEDEVDAVEDEVETQAVVVAATAEEVLDGDDDDAKAHNPDHGKPRPKAWELMLCGRGHSRKD